MKTIFVITLLLLTASLSASDIWDYNGHDWNSFTDTEKTFYVRGFIIGHTTLYSMKARHEYPSIIFRQGNLDKFVFDLLNAYYSEVSHRSDIIWAVWYAHMDAINDYIKALCKSTTDNI